MERYQDYGPSGHRNRLHAGQHQSQVCYVPLGLGLRFSLRCGEFQVLVGFRGEGGGESGVGVKNLESFGAGIWRPLLAPSTYAIHSKGTFLASKFRDSNVRKNVPSVVFLGGGRGYRGCCPESSVSWVCSDPSSKVATVTSSRSSIRVLGARPSRHCHDMEVTSFVIYASAVHRINSVPSICLPSSAHSQDGFSPCQVYRYPGIQVYRCTTIQKYV